MTSAPLQAISAPPEDLAGLVERVTFHNEENGFCVLRFKARGQRDLITVHGHAAMISAGEWVQAAGTWGNHRTHGLQFRANFLGATAPTTPEGIEKYLGSGMIRDIGRAYAKRLADPSGCTKPKGSARCGRSALPLAGRRRSCARSCCSCTPVEWASLQPSDLLNLWC